MQPNRFLCMQPGELSSGQCPANNPCQGSPSGWPTYNGPNWPSVRSAYWKTLKDIIELATNCKEFGRTSGWEQLSEQDIQSIPHKSSITQSWAVDMTSRQMTLTTALNWTKVELLPGSQQTMQWNSNNEQSSIQLAEQSRGWIKRSYMAGKKGAAQGIGNIDEVDWSMIAISLKWDFRTSLSKCAFLVD